MAQPGAREFHLEHLPEYDTRSSATWIVSHSLRYWWLPVTVVVTAIVNNAA
jgi:hypothetical protein